jgi:hypothetical protein
MMYMASEKLAIIRLVEESELSVRRTLQEIKLYLGGREVEQRYLDVLRC